jgi:hypothetical protein
MRKHVGVRMLAASLPTAAIAAASACAGLGRGYGVGRRIAATRGSVQTTACA